MDAEQARELALNARLDHWPPHLGVKTDAEKIEYLAVALDEASTGLAIWETAPDKTEELRDEISKLRDDFQDTEIKLDEMRDRVDELENKLSEQ